MSNREDVLYPPRIVSKALSIPAGTLATWAKRGWMANLDAAFAEGRGKARMFTLRDVLALALIKYASDKGTTQPEIISYAPDAADAFLRHPDQIKHLIVRWYQQPSKCAIRFDDELHDTPADPDADFIVMFNIRSIFDAAAKLITAAAKTEDIETETSIEKIRPSLPPIERGWKWGE